MRRDPRYYTIVPFGFALAWGVVLRAWPALLMALAVNATGDPRYFLLMIVVFLLRFLDGTGTIHRRRGCERHNPQGRNHD